jgi:hypothetical protein
MENNEKVIGNVTEKKVEQEDKVDLSVRLTAVAIGGAVKQLADKNVYLIGLAAGLLFGKTAGYKTIGTIVGAGAIYNTAKYISNGCKFDSKK